MTSTPKIGRNDPCICGSGKKYKQCCQPQQASTPIVTPPTRTATSTVALLQEALAHLEAGQLDESEALCRSILEKGPHQDALHLLGLSASRRGQFALSESLIKKALKVKIPQEQKNIHGLMHFNLAKTLSAQQKPDEAIEHYKKALVFMPDCAEAHCDLGVSFMRKGNIPAAVERYRRAISINPDAAEAHYNLGAALKSLHQVDAAIACYQRAIEIFPNFAEAYSAMGNSIKDKGDLETAIRYYQRSVEIRPDFTEGYTNLGILLYERLDTDDAIMYLEKALAINPIDVVALNAIALAFRAKGRMTEAIECYKKAISAEQNLQSYVYLAIMYSDVSDFKAAVATLQAALTIDPDYTPARTALVYAITHIPEYTPEQYLEEARLYGQKVSKRAKPYAYKKAELLARSQRPLRVGLVSGDLLHHPVGYFLEGIIGHLDRTKIDLVAYVTRHLEHDLTQRIKPYFSGWHYIVEYGDQGAAQKIHDDEIDILFDLSGHTGHNRLSMFAWKPAPIQVTWLGYFASTGVPAIDYILTDPVSVPETCRAHYSEKTWYLPETRLCFTPPPVDIPVAPAPYLQNGYITFGCFQRETKVTKEVLDLWGAIFRAVPTARLRLQNKQFIHRSDDIYARLANVGIAPERVSIHGDMLRYAYLAAHSEVDIILDTFPFTGGATTCESLWMGIPTVTMMGNSMLSSQGASLISAAGLGDWVAQTPEEYVAKAVLFANNSEYVAQLRAVLRPHVLSSPLFDTQRFAKNFEAALYGMWQETVNQCAG